MTTMISLKPLSPVAANEMSLQLMTKAKASKNCPAAATPCHKTPQDYRANGDFSEALLCYQRAAAQGHAPACAAAAWLYIDELAGGSSSGDAAYTCGALQLMCRKV
jgi:TPR repeat protein